MRETSAVVASAPVLMSVRMVVRVAALVGVGVGVRVSVCVRRLAAVLVAVTMEPACLGMRTGFGLKRGLLLGHAQMHVPEQIGQRRVGFELQMVGLQLKLHVPVAQVVGRAQQVERAAVLGAGAHHHHRLNGCVDPDQGAVLAYQHIAATHHAAAW